MNSYVAIITPIVSLITFFLGYYFNKLKEKRTSDKELNKGYLSRLRLYLEESYYRLYEIETTLKNGKQTPLLYIQTSSEVSKQDWRWFVNEGCYLISTSYYVACLFGAIEKLREQYPYIKGKKADDTLIMNKVFKVNLAFRKDLTVYYVLQHNIGQLMYKKLEDRLLSYTEYVELLKNDNSVIWFSRLIDLLLEVGRGERMENLELALDSMFSLSTYLEKEYRLGPSIEGRVFAETMK